MNGGGGKYVEGEEAMVEASLRTMSLNNAKVPATDQMHVLLGDNSEKKRKKKKLKKKSKTAAATGPQENATIDNHSPTGTRRSNDAIAATVSVKMDTLTTKEPPKAIQNGAHSMSSSPLPTSPPPSSSEADSDEGKPSNPEASHWSVVAGTSGDGMAHPTPRLPSGLASSIPSSLHPPPSRTPSSALPPTAQAPPGPHPVMTEKNLLDLLSGKTLPPAISSSIPRPHRGLVNAGNTCFQNLVLQALLASEPLHRLLLALRPLVLASSSPASPSLSLLARRCQALVPTWMDMAKVAVALEDPSLVAASTASPALVMYKKKDSAVAGRKSGKKHLVGTGSSSSSSSFPPLPSHPSGVANGFKLHGPLEARSPSPRDFYLAPLRPDDYLEEAFRAFRSSEAGEQEDAQEFLAFLLDRLHEEAVGAGAGGEEGKGAREEEEGEGGWQEVGEKGRVAKLSVSGVKQTEKGTPDVSAISRLFYGRERSDIRRATSRSISATMTRFNCLQLDLPPLGGGGKKEVALEEVIEHSFREEVIESSDGTFLRKKLCLDALPPVLILHLKRFIFDLHQGVGVKLHHRVHYPSCLRLPSQMLSVSLRTTAGIEGGEGERKGLAYELFAVGLHYGRSLNGGHYTVFCKEGGCGKEWVGYDDERVDRVQEWEVKSYTEQVYLLFYKRV